jgi:hypothetical protein
MLANAGARRALLARSSIARVRTHATATAQGGAVARAQRSALVRGGAERPPAPAFMQQPTPTAPLHEQADAIWDDGVAPEMTLDFDAPHVPRWMTAAMWFGGLGFFVAVYQYVKYVKQPEKNAYAVHRKYDEEILRRSLGGYPDPTYENAPANCIGGSS